MSTITLPSREWAEGVVGMPSIYLLLKAVLQHPARAEAQAAILASLIDFIWTGIVEQEKSVNWQFWPTLLEIIEHIPPDHQCQNSIIQALSLLCQKKPNQIGHLKSWKSVKSASSPQGWESQYTEDLWTDLPGFRMFAVEAVYEWSDPSEMIPESSDEDRSAPKPRLEYIKWLARRPESDFVKNANLHSFLARFAGTGFGPQWTNFAIWMLRSALEEPAVEGKPMSYRLWIATEWLLLTSGMEIEVDKKSLRTGQLCENIPWIGVERWNYWKTRAASVAEALDDWQGDGPFANRIALTLECMARAEEAAIARGSVNYFTPSPATTSSVTESSTTVQPDTSSTQVPNTDTPTEAHESSIPCTATPSSTTKPKQRRWWLW
ncbi:hypothetical protein LTR27_003084 [Elasticomyces elasticus]|nr:hypothetical protein LTR27_003084 [Elasticomyces elasticus]